MFVSYIFVYNSYFFYDVFSNNRKHSVDPV